MRGNCQTGCCGSNQKKPLVLWIDEAHDLFHSEGPGETDEILYVLRSLMQDEISVVLIFSGTDRLAGIDTRDSLVDRRLARIVLRR